MAPSPDPARPGPRSFAVIVPVKPPAVGKSRLAGLPDDLRRDLAAAFALDTVRAARATNGVVAVLAVTDDFRFAADLRRAGCEVIPDGAADDLNATVAQAAAEVARRWPDATPVVLLSDLPALRAAELAEVLAALPADRGGFLRDLPGTGTTLYGAPSAQFAPRFGPRSADAHAASGAVEIDVPAPSVRRDVDDAGDLAAAMLLGLGPHTAAVTGRS